MISRMKSWGKTYIAFVTGFAVGTLAGALEAYLIIAPIVLAAVHRH